MVYTVIYNWNVANGLFAKFEQNWEDITNDFLSNSDSLGSVLYTSKDQTNWVRNYTAIAGWPSKQVYENRTIDGGLVAKMNSPHIDFLGFVAFEGEPDEVSETYAVVKDLRKV